MNHFEVIKELICAKQKEGDFHDFKQEWHASNADLIHDILCFSNSLSVSQYRYIIIGVDDTDFSIKSVENDKKRKRQSGLLDTLHHALNSMPEVSLETIDYEGAKLDVIIITASAFRPYYLSKDYPRDSKNPLRAGVIYSRVGDRNTGVNETAKGDAMEKLWRIRFGLDKSPLERGITYLHQPSKWKENYIAGSSTGDYEQYYFEEFPKFVVRLMRDGSNKFNELGIVNKFPDKSPGSWYDCQLLYGQTLLIRESFIFIDGGRYMVALPERRENGGYFYVKNSNRYLLSVFINKQKKYNMEHYNFDTFSQRIGAEILTEAPARETTF